MRIRMKKGVSGIYNGKPYRFPPSDIINIDEWLAHDLVRGDNADYVDKSREPKEAEAVVPTVKARVTTIKRRKRNV